MPIDFTTYRDPGVYVEAVTPSTIDSASIAPTLVALVGEAPSYQDFHESFALSRNAVRQLASKGVLPSSVSCANILTREQYSSGVIGTLSSNLADDATSAYVTVFDNVALPATPFDIRIGDEIITVGGASFGTLTRGVGTSDAADHNSGDIVNLYEEYAQGDLLGSLNAPIGSSDTIFSVTSDEVLDIDSYIEVDGERMLLTGATTGTATNEQILTVVRGVAGTRALPHGANSFYGPSGAHFFLTLGLGETSATNDNDLSIGIVGDSLGDGTTVDIYLKKADEGKYLPTLVDRMDAVVEKYGAPFNSDGTLNSDLSLAAQLAFANGAQRLVMLQVDTDTDTDWTIAMDLLARETTVTAVVPITGDDEILNLFRFNNNQLASQSILRRLFVGYDGVSQTLTSNAFVTAAQTFFDERVTLVAPGAFTIVNKRGTVRQTTDVAGYFAAAALAGLHASLAPQEPLTRKQVYGISSIPNQDALTNIINMQSKGVTVLYQDRLGRVIVKHGLTTNTTSLYTKEISIVVARDRLQSFIQDTLESGNLIGSAMTSRTPNLVLGAVTGSLETAMLQGLIADYSDVMYRIPESNPTVVEIRFMYKPTLPLNYIYVQFTIDTATGSLEFTTVNN